jgi:hypothetical protein
MKPSVICVGRVKMPSPSSRRRNLACKPSYGGTISAILPGPPGARPTCGGSPRSSVPPRLSPSSAQQMSARSSHTAHASVWHKPSTPSSRRGHRPTQPRHQERHPTDHRCRHHRPQCPPRPGPRRPAVCDLARDRGLRQRRCAARPEAIQTSPNWLPCRGLGPSLLPASSSPSNNATVTPRPTSFKSMRAVRL